LSLDGLVKRGINPRPTELLALRHSARGVRRRRGELERVAVPCRSKARK
jgi:hypothetical protein